MGDEVLTVSALTKRYGPTVALSGVSITIGRGEVHAILGENGAGKSTLVKCLSGVVVPNTGKMELDGSLYAPDAIVTARHSGVSTAFQELSLVPNLSVGENLLLPRASQNRFWPETASSIRKRAQNVLDEWNISDISPASRLDELSLAERQRIEIARALRYATKLLILDEPTAALPDPGWLFDQIRLLVERGVSVMYISHRLAEVREICQSATVLRNGTSIDSVDLAGVDDDAIFAMMVGHKPDQQRVSAVSQHNNNSPALETENLFVGKAKAVNFTLARGEIVGLAALEGQGQHDFMNALGGVLKPTSGSILLDGVPLKLGSPRQALQAGRGIAFVPEERKTEGIFPDLSAASNIALANLGRTTRLGLVTSHMERRGAADVAKDVSLTERYLSFPVHGLSGGNQQKVLLARALMTGAKTLVLFDPARGVDVGTKQAIYKMMQAFVGNGGAIIFYSSELSELVSLCSRCLVMYEGTIVANLTQSELNEEALVAAAHGHSAIEALAG